MSGIYIHIPFCASRCIYCDFYSTTLRDKSNEYVDALLKELNERSDFLPSREPLRTIYIGGGTPSQLPVSELHRLIGGIVSKFSGKASQSSQGKLNAELEELTIEANPEDVTEEWAEEIGKLRKEIEDYAGKNILRISLGVQSLDDSELKLLNRRHDSRKPALAVRLLREVGIANISLDLMYGLPTQTMLSWERSIDGIVKLVPEHISAYSLSVEGGTQMERLVYLGKLTPADDELCLAMAARLREKLREAGYMQYEISNYAQPGFESKHNSSYWDGTPYLGLGPGAHSYDGYRRRVWNEPNLKEYLRGNRIENGETLSDTDIYNERIMLGLRTSSGVPVSICKTPTKINSLIARNLIKIDSHSIVLTEHGLALADEVIRELII